MKLSNSIESLSVLLKHCFDVLLRGAHIQSRVVDESEKMEDVAGLKHDREIRANDDPLKTKRLDYEIQVLKHFLLCEVPLVVERS